jgi:DnaJ-domain-containing protein 1
MVVLVLVALEYGGIFGWGSAVVICVSWMVYARAVQQRKREELQQEARGQAEAEFLRQARREREADRSRHRAEQERQRERQRQREATTQSEPVWFKVLEVTPTARKDQIVRNYRRKIQQCHPDRVAGLAPEFIQLAEERTKLLNSAYAEAVRICR